MKQKRYWLRGGITSLIVLITFFIIEHLVSNSCSTKGVVAIVDACYDKIDLVFDPIYSIIHSSDFIYYLVLPFAGKDPSGWGHIWTQWPSFFVIGSFIGWIYGKVKNRSGMVSQ